MPKLRDRLRLVTTGWRDRLGMLCAVGAVACLASMIAHWSRQYPVHRSSWERNLFGDLSEPASPDSKPADVIAVEAPFVSVNVDPTQPDDPASTVPILVEVTPNPVGQILALPIEDRPIEHQPRFIQPVLHEQPTSGFGVSAWLSGGIEIDTDEPTDQIEDGPALVFPNDETTP